MSWDSLSWSSTWLLPEEPGWGRTPLSFSVRLHAYALHGNIRRRYNRPRYRRAPAGVAINEDHTTAAVQRYLDELAGDTPVEPVVRALLDRAVRRLHQLCATLRYRQGFQLRTPSFAMAGRPPQLSLLIVIGLSAAKRRIASCRFSSEV